MTPHPKIAPWFFPSWIVLGVVGTWVLYFDRNVERKKKFLPIYIIGAGALFIGFVFALSGDPNVLLFMVPAVVLICFLILRMIQICSACGRTITDGMMLTRADYCSKCGARLE